MHDDEFIPVGEHFTFLLEKDRVYDIFRPYPNAWHALVQVTKPVWYRMDGGIPTEDLGFEAKAGEPHFYMAINNDWKLVTKFQNTWLQAQWYGLRS